VGYGGNPRQVVDMAMDFDFVLRAITTTRSRSTSEGLQSHGAKAVYWTREQLKRITRHEKRPERWSFMRRKLHIKVQIGICSSYTERRRVISSTWIGLFGHGGVQETPSEIKTMFCGHTHIAGVFVEDTDGFIR